MLKKTLTIWILTICGFMGLQAVEQQTSLPTEETEILEETHEKTQELAGCKKCRDRHIIVVSEENTLELARCKKCRDRHIFGEDDLKDLTPGVLVCDDKEDKCKKQGDKEASSEDHFLVCKDCR